MIEMMKNNCTRLPLKSQNFFTPQPESEFLISVIIGKIRKQMKKKNFCTRLPLQYASKIFREDSVKTPFRTTMLTEN